jgi:DNA-binding transcriptional MerR regulator
MNLDNRLTIGQLSQRTGVKVVTIRYYEGLKLMPAPPRTQANYRVYDRQQLCRLRFIRRCRDLGFTLGQIRELLNLWTQAATECSGVDRITDEHLKEIESKVDDLRRLAAELRRVKNCCPGKRLIANCRILEALSGNVSRSRLRTD